MRFRPIPAPLPKGLPLSLLPSNPLTSGAPCKRGPSKLMSTILIIILVLLLVGALPTWGWSSGWGPYPAGGLGLLLLILLILVLTHVL